MSVVIDLPDADGGVARHVLRGAPAARPASPRFNRDAFAAVHVVRNPRADALDAIDWDATLAFRDHILDLGFGVAEAMDTAQRGMGLGAEAAMTLVERSAAAAGPARRGRIAAGVCADALPDDRPHDLDAIAAAYLSQLGRVQRAGVGAVLMASRALARAATGPQDYAAVYARVLAEADRPVILHWLGEMFDPALAGYWGAATPAEAAETVLAIIDAAPGRVAGIKLSLLDGAFETALRRRLPAGVRMYTGDDFNYPALIRGDDEGHSDALLGAFDPLATVASAALTALGAGDGAGYDRLMAPTLPLARKLFEAPTSRYKTGVVFLAWLNGRQDHFTMIAGAESARSLPHLAELFRLADACGALEDPDLATARLRALLAIHGVGASGQAVRRAG